MLYLLSVIPTAWNSLPMYVYLYQSIRTFEAACKYAFLSNNESTHTIQTPINSDQC